MPDSAWMLPKRSAIARALNTVSRPVPRPRFDLERLRRKAETLTGLSCWDNIGAFDEGLAWLLEEFDEAAHLSFLGHQSAYQELLSLLASRLRIEQYRRTHSLAAQESTLPVAVVIVSPARTGTTLLFNTMYATGLFRSPLMWELQHVASPKDRGSRIDAVKRSIWLSKILSPSVGDIHPLDPEGPEECAPLLNRSFLSMDLPFRYSLSRCTERVWSLPPGVHSREVYRYHALQLRIIEHEREQVRHTIDPRPWLLKAPAHACAIESLASAYPNAKLVVNVRSPSLVVSSLAALAMSLRQVTLRQSNARAAGADALDASAKMWKRLADFSQRESRRMCIVRYDDLLSDAIGTVRRLLNLSGISFEEADLARANDWRRRQQPEHKPFPVRLEDYALDKATVEAMLGPWIDRIEHLS